MGVWFGFTIDVTRSCVAPVLKPRSYVVVPSLGLANKKGLEIRFLIVEILENKSWNIFLDTKYDKHVYCCIQQTSATLFVYCVYPAYTSLDC